MPSHADALGRSASLAWLVVPLALSAACGPPSPHDAQGTRDSVLFVTLDTTRRDHMGFHGRAPSPTPELDRLAAESIVFEDAYTVAPLTLPAHVSMFTGLYPMTHGVRDNSSFRLSEQAVTLAELLLDEGYRTGAAVAAAVLDDTFGLAQGFESYTAPRRFPGEASEHYVERPADAMVSEALARIAELPEPFAFWLHLFDPHAPYEAPGANAAGGQQSLGQRYEAEIRFADAQIGRLLDELRARPLWDRLIVVFCADHGEGLDQGREETHGHFVDDVTLRIPLLLRHPRLEARRVGAVVSLVDVMPTLIGWLGLEAPDRPLDGIDLSDAIAAGSAELARDVALESYYVYWSFGWAPYESLVNGDEKFIRSRANELFDRRRDPGSRTNLFDAGEAHSLEWLRRVEQRFSRPSDPSLIVQYEATGEELGSLAALGYAVGPQPEAGSRTDFAALPDAGTKLDVIARIAAAHDALAREDVDLALRLMEQSCAEEPASSFFHFEFASTLLAYRPERWKEAEAALERAVELDFHRPDAFNNLGALHTKRWEEASAEARELLAAGDEARARELNREGRRARVRAAQLFRDALERDPRHVEALANLARLLQVDAERALQKGEREEALRLYREVVELLTGFTASLPEGHPNRGRVEGTFERCRARLAELARR